ncbi:hypothetical protein [Paenibacillus montanisoli]|uniref:Uncharacterized protein n=1 Tax=Paenibacillus montanisoli TaxID=2081970 RepID=A0A328U539_9BACL|nr:hypothetical protein [Paenibacillus montanisoli]RAP75016.1 hypothetical protein DL346_16615 [Paenibacillus montanisoli]
MSNDLENDKRKIILTYHTGTEEIEIIETKPHHDIDKYLVPDKSIRLDTSQAKNLYLFLKNVFSNSDS